MAKSSLVKTLVISIAYCSFCYSSEERIQYKDGSTNLLNADTIYYYKSSFDEFKDRISWISKIKKEDLDINKTGSSAAMETAGFWAGFYEGSDAKLELTDGTKMRKFDYNKLLWEQYYRNNSRFNIWRKTNFRNYSRGISKGRAERIRDSVLKINGNGEWELEPIDEISVRLDERHRKLFQALSDYTKNVSQRVAKIQSGGKVSENAGALIFRKSDKTVLFIVGIKWNKPVFGDHYTEYVCEISQVTGAIVSDSFSYTTTSFKPGKFEQWTELAADTAKAIAFIASLL